MKSKRKTATPAAPSAVAPDAQIFIEDFRGMPENMAASMDASRIRAAMECAEQGQVSDLWALYSGIVAGDSWIQGLLATRKLAVLNADIKAIPADAKNADDVEAAESATTMIGGIRSFRRGVLSHLLDAVLWPVSVAEKVYRSDESHPGTFVLDRIVPVLHHVEDYATGRLQLRRQDPLNGRATEVLYPIESARHIVHRGSMLSAPDNWGGPFRSLLVLWLLRTCNREWWARNTERWGSPFPIGKYPQGDREAKSKLQSAFSNFLRLGGLVVSDQTTVDLVRGADAGSTDAFERLQTWAETQIQILIVGQQLSSTAAATGMGSGVADLQSTVRNDMTRFDARLLAETLDDQLVRPHLQINGLSGSCHLQIGDATDLSRAATLATILPGIASAGLQPTADGIAAMGRILGVELQVASGLPLSRDRVAALSQALRDARSPDLAGRAMLSALGPR